MSSVNTTISFSFLCMHHKIQKEKKNPCKKWSKIFGKHENLLSRINFCSFLPKMLSTRFMPQILLFYNEKQLFQGKFPQKSFIMQTQIFIYNFSGFVFDPTKVEEICFD